MRQGEFSKEMGPYDTACFHAQQAAEKYLKGLLAYLDQPFPFTHNLEELEELCRSRVRFWPLSDVDLAVLTPYAVETRYDFEFWPERATAQEALALGERVRTGILSLVSDRAHP